ncbi:MAG: YcbK family protein [Methylophaga sp.]|nr:YcbK family protein [Methylophaga sp.]
MCDKFRRFDRPQLATCQHRRRLLKLSFGATATMLVMPPAFANLAKLPERKIALYNLHTGEQLKTTYWAEGHYQNSELHAISHIMRDHRTNEMIDMDNDLIDLMTILHRQMQGKQPYHIISGYRSAKTNEMLRKTGGGGVAKKSFHTLGQAVDVRLPGRQLAELHEAALKLHAGGVGYYPTSDFVHIDTGPVRQWRG